MKKMRHFTRVLCAGGLLLAMLLQAACGAAASKPGFVGKWLFSSMESGGEKMTAAQLGSMDVVTMEFTSDGKAKLGGEGNSATGKWTEKNGTITIVDDESGQTDTGTLTDADTMVLKNGEDTITLVRDGSDAAKKIAAGIPASASAGESAAGESTTGESESSMGNEAAGGTSAESSGQTESSAASMMTESTGTASSADSSAFTLVPVTVENSEIFSQEGVSVSITGYSDKDYYGPALEVQIVNSSDQDIAVQTSDSSVNGYMITYQLWQEVGAGKKANSEIYLPVTYLQDAGIDTIAEMEFRLSLVNPKDYSTVVTSDPITVKTSAYGSYTQKDRDDGTELYNKDGVRIISLGYGTDAFMNQAVMIFADNQTDKSIEISVDKTSVDDTMVDASLYIDLLPGKKAVSGITFMDTLTDPSVLDCVFDIEDMATYEYIDESEHVQISMK
ncbi:MAG: hypothetical protein LKM35_07980 [Lachnospiraceae bacterium]|jgi:hypothetical protein|nr:hypothetical protein [Lachnospiraceae bacterium]MCI1727591.1 hypothetical protein [Lachnospiraceae bacterium]